MQNDIVKATLEMLGHEVEDMVTGRKGVVTSACFDLYGCVQVVISVKVKDNPKNENFIFDVKRMKVKSTKRIMDLPEYARDTKFESPVRRGQEGGAAEKPSSIGVAG
jgi:hypothetical protein